MVIFAKLFLRDILDLGNKYAYCCKVIFAQYSGLGCTGDLGVHAYCCYLATIIRFSLKQNLKLGIYVFYFGRVYPRSRKGHQMSDHLVGE